MMYLPSLIMLLDDIDSVILYAACLEGSDPIRLFEKRINARRGKYQPNVFFVIMFCFHLQHSHECRNLIVTSVDHLLDSS